MFPLRIFRTAPRRMEYIASIFSVPLMKKMVDFSKKQIGLKDFYHCEGFIYLISDIYLEPGDVLYFGFQVCIWYMIYIYIYIYIHICIYDMYIYIFIYLFF